VGARRLCSRHSCHCQRSEGMGASVAAREAVGSRHERFVKEGNARRERFQRRHSS
jgi:hypothetical protein